MLTPARRALLPLLLLASLRVPASAGGFEDGWKWYRHRRDARAPEAELIHILETLKSKYPGHPSMTDVERELEKRSADYSAPRRGAAARAGFDDGWKWYLHRKDKGAPDGELAGLLKTLIAKYEGLGVDVAEARREQSLYASAAKAPRASAPPPARRARPADAESDVRLRARLAETKSADPKVRLKAAKDLKEMRDPRSVEGLVGLLGDADTFVAVVAANALVAVGEPSLAPLIAAAGSEDPAVRVVASMALGDLGHPDAVPALERNRRDRSGKVKEAAANALSKIKSKGSEARWKKSSAR